MWDVKACRGCLAVTGKLEKINDALKKLYTAVTDLTITEGDGYPTYFCLECRTHLRKCFAFRRKTRRAHFVMKEIMNVRKQVSYSDIVTVNRKKTNLQSSLGYWEPQNSCYWFVKQDYQTVDTVVSDVVKSQKGTYTANLDIPPEIKEPVPEEDNTTDNAENANIPDETPDMDEGPINAEDLIEPEDKPEEKTEDIDLNDVFKGLEDNVNTDDDDYEPPVQKEKPKSRRNPNKLPLSTVLDAIMKCKIRVLTLEEQKEKMELRKEMEPFVSAKYKCSMCFTVYKCMDQLQEHVVYHNGRRDGMPCEVCRNKFTSVEELNVHVARCHMYEYTCRCHVKCYCLIDVVRHHKDCPRRVTKRREHLIDVLKNFTMTPLTQQQMMEVQAVASKEGPGVNPIFLEPPDFITSQDYNCDICGMWIKSYPNMERHMILRHKYLYTCKECKQYCTTRAQALKHAAVHRSLKPWACGDCDQTFSKFKMLNFHRWRSHHSRIPCNICGREFTTLRAYYKHQLNKHHYISLNDPLVGDPEHACSTCGVQFLDTKSRDTHILVSAHAGADKIPFACIPCKKVFDNDDQLCIHRDACAYRQYPRKCCYCSEILLNGLHYKTHYMNEHPSLQYRYTSKNTICELCGKSIYKPHLEAHIKAHTKAAYDCRHCGFASTTATMHVGHMLRAHAARPYCCGLCSRRFQHRGDCKDHILKVHAPAKLYKCEFCGMEFAYFRHLRTHSAKLHNLTLPLIRGKPVRSQSKIFVYAHMKIEICDLEREAVAKTEVELLDYLDQKSKPVSYEDYFIFSSEPDEYIAKKLYKKKKKSKAKKVTEPNIKIESDILLKEGVDVGTELERAVKGIEFDVKDVKEPKLEIESEMEEAPSQEVFKTEDVVNEAMEVDTDKPLEVFENDDGQFVMINGELYRIACDGEM